MHTFRVRRKDGQYRIYRLKCVPIFDESGNFVQWIGGSRDVTEEKEAEQRIRDLNRQLVSRTRELEELNSELSAFTYSVSHDLRAPLRAMEGFSAAITEDYAGQLDETGRNYLQRIRSASLRMSEMIDALLTLSRLTRKPPEMETIDLTAMAEDIFNLLRASDPKRNVNITIAPDMTDRGDPRLIRLVLQNLFANAWKFTSKRLVAEIEFGMLKTKGERVYFVRDNGAGFDMTYAEKLFTPFQRLHRADEFEGSGIGLATVQRIIRLHGGYVRAEGKQDNGAVFYFTLKVDDPEAN
jgi:light-regulated signal transduction histidine kinase (bacteriophytochrome)